MRIYDPRVGRFLSVDPLGVTYPYYTPYQFAGNMPIAAIDLDGLEQYVVIYYKDQNKTTTSIQIRTVEKNNGQALDQHVHKVGTTVNIAYGNVLVFEATRAKYGYENMEIVKGRNVANSSLTAQELAISKNKTPEQERGEYQALGYGGYDKGKAQYESRFFQNSKTQTFSSDFGIAPPPESAQTGTSKISPKQQTKTITNLINSKINFEGDSNTPINYKNEIDRIYSIVKSADVADYSITISGNTDGFFWEDFDSAPSTLPDQYSNMGALARARAESIKGLLVGKGLDGSKIHTKLGSPTKGMNVDYKIATEIKQKD